VVPVFWYCQTPTPDPLCVVALVAEQFAPPQAGVSALLTCCNTETLNGADTDFAPLVLVAVTVT
jgi:hypothetical protein